MLMLTYLKVGWGILLMLSGEDDGWLSKEASSAKSDAKTVVTYLGEQSSDVGYFVSPFLNFGQKLVSNGINCATSTGCQAFWRLLFGLT